MWIFGQWFHFHVMMIQTLRGAFISIPKGGWEIAKFWINDFTIQQYLPTWNARKPNKNHRTTKKHRCGSFFFATHFFRGLWWLVVASNIFHFHPYFGKISNLTGIFQMGWFNHQPDELCVYFPPCDPWLCSRAPRRWPATWVKPYCARRETWGSIARVLVLGVEAVKGWEKWEKGWWNHEAR